MGILFKLDKYKTILYLLEKIVEIKQFGEIGFKKKFDLIVLGREDERKRSFLSYLWRPNAIS
jgi:hypothetical protein